MPPFLSIQPIEDHDLKAGELREIGPRWLPPVLGLVTILVYWWVWGALNPGPRHFDETAYLLQARIFAGGHWTAPGRPLPWRNAAPPVRSGVLNRVDRREPKARSRSTSSAP